MIELRDVTVTFGRTRALRDVTVSIGPGITGLFGSNGSGKSTLLRLLTGLLRPTSGQITIDGDPLDIRDERLRASIGYAGHEAGLYSDLTVRENLELFARLHGASPNDVGSVCDELQLEEVIDAGVGSLSAGTKRRVSVARALVHRPGVLLLDEPYANLDDDASDSVSAAIERWASGGGIGVVASHGAKRVKAYASAGIVLQRGTVSAHGTYSDRFQRS